jgi:hypothetical protein
MRRGCRVGIAAGGALLAAALLPSTAAAVVPYVTNDAGALVPVTPGLVIRNMNASVGYALSPGEGLIRAQITGPDNQPVASASNCSSYVAPRLVDYRGNGAYTILVNAYLPNDFNCATPIAATAAVYFVNAYVAVAPPGGRQLIRAANAFGLRTIDVPIVLNPGALTHEIRYKRAGKTGADGAIIGASKEGFEDRARSVVPLRLEKPGKWIIVARAKGFTASTAGGQFYTPWSKVGTINGIAPFDIRSESFPDSRGPSYQLKASLGEPSARGFVTVSIAPGKKGGSFRPLGRAKLGKNATFFKRFSVPAPGVYRLRITRKKTATMAGGVITRPITISRRFF